MIDVATNRLKEELDTAQARVRELEAQLAAAQKVKADYDRWLSGGVYFTTAEYKKHVAEHRQQVEALQCELLKWKRALCNLTPGGSEFADDHAYCAEWVRKARENQQDIIMSKHRELKAAQAALNRLKAQRISELQTQLTQLQAMARALIYSDNAPEHVRAWFALRATLDATTPAGRQE